MTEDVLALLEDPDEAASLDGGTLANLLAEGIDIMAITSPWCVSRAHVTFQPRADAEHFSVALASMVSKYVREVLMGEFNRFWCEQVPGLKPTAGYPGDSRRFYDAIRPAAERLGIPEAALWRRK